MIIGILTFHRSLNYGAVLQTYGLQKFLSQNFCDETYEIVDYRCPRFTDLYESFSFFKRKSIKNLLKDIHFLVKRKVFNDFISKHLNVSAISYSTDSIIDANKRYDKFIVGSDQVWNAEITNGDLNYLLKFATPDKRNSYAASIGKNIILKKYEEEYRNEINFFGNLSVREQECRLVLQEIGITSKIQVNVDPTLLLKTHEWLELISDKRICNRYVLVYAIKYSNELLETAIGFAEKRGYKVIYIGPRTKCKGIKRIRYAKVTDFVRYFRDAEYTFINSFHGTVFSVIFHKQFWVCNEENDWRNVRIENLLQLCELKDRFEFSNIHNDIDWNKVEEKINSERDKAFNYLKEIIEYENS